MKAVIWTVGLLDCWTILSVLLECDVLLYSVGKVDRCVQQGWTTACRLENRLARQEQNSTYVQLIISMSIEAQPLLVLVTSSLGRK